MTHRMSVLLMVAAAAVCCRHAPPPAARATTTSLPVNAGDATIARHVFRSGDALDGLRIHYSTLGTPRKNAAGEIVNAVLVQHWTTASSVAVQTPEFAEALCAPGRALDPAKYFLVFIDNVGHGASSKPSDGLHAKFPRYGYRDMVDLQHHVVHEVLGIKRLHAIVGLSMGGMHAWLWAENYPDEVSGIMPIVSLPTRIAGWNLIWRRIVTRAIRNDPEWNGGDYGQPPRGWIESFPLFRMMLDGVPHLQSVAPDRAAADAFVNDATVAASKMDANDVLYSLESSEDYDPEPGLSRIRAKVTVLNFGDDEFNPIELRALDALPSKVPQARVVVQPGDEHSFGHLTQAHPALFSSHVATFMQELGEP